MLRFVPLVFFPVIGATAADVVLPAGQAAVDVVLPANQDAAGAAAANFINRLKLWKELGDTFAKKNAAAAAAAAAKADRATKWQERVDAKLVQNTAANDAANPHNVPGPFIASTDTIYMNKAADGAAANDINRLKLLSRTRR